jgi:hypothetical protein
MRFRQRPKKLSRHTNRNSALYHHNRFVADIALEHLNCAADMRGIDFAIATQHSWYAYEEVRRVLQISFVV